ncbi:GNAT family N-acetyltransferase [Paenibacillus sp. AN1007]|jgi:GNAT superfamily N-acetyltransferase|uniref:GNAT family N-acetyltransferase n=1 Tax=Paenibacillus sp. AN1007 TaxID=3151385 RepID=A0AAU8NKE3_9BACL
MNYIIRQAVLQDLPGLCSVRNNEKLFRSYLNQQENNKVILVAAAAEDIDHVILGFGLLKLHGMQVPKLSDLYVKEEFRGQGAGSAMIKYREKCAIGLGFNEIFVSVDPVENPKMIKLITSHGYQAITEPYTKEAVYYNEDGSGYKKTYIRVDLKKQLL